VGVNVSELHKLLVAKQPIEEVYRKMRKAARPGWWTQEDADWINHQGMIGHAQRVYNTIFRDIVDSFADESPPKPGAGET
jgi:hypothetical protein